MTKNTKVADIKISNQISIRLILQTELHGELHTVPVEITLPADKDEDISANAVQEHPLVAQKIQEKLLELIVEEYSLRG